MDVTQTTDALYTMEAYRYLVNMLFCPQGPRTEELLNTIGLTLCLQKQSFEKCLRQAEVETSVYIYVSELFCVGVKRGS